ncbi:MAG: group I intron-associated PD-(D/E)XK endonuclease [Candidatus Sulfotelmatobacter sp.]
MKRRKAKVIKEPKARGEWVESVFMARAGELGLAVSKPWGDSRSYDFVVGRPGHFVGVQVKSTIAEMGGGYGCTVKRNNKAYSPGSFDFVAAYVIPEDAWYIVPVDKFAGRVTLVLCSNSGEAKYEEYREAWDLLREASQGSQDEVSEEAPSADVPGEDGADAPVAATHTTGALARMEAAFNFARRYMEGNYPRAQKRDEEPGGK